MWTDWQTTFAQLGLLSEQKASLIDHRLKTLNKTSSLYSYSFSLPLSRWIKYHDNSLYKYSKQDIKYDNHINILNKAIIFNDKPNEKRKATDTDTIWQYVPRFPAALSSADSYLNRFLHDCGLSFSGEFVEKSKMK